MKRVVGLGALIQVVLLASTGAWGSHRDKEIEALKEGMERARLNMQRAATRNVMGSLGDNRGAVTAEAADLEKLLRELSALQERAPKEHAAQGKVDPKGTHTQYVLDSLKIPTTANEANVYGLNLDGDEEERPDNALGQILSTVGSSRGDINLQETVDAQIMDGDIILLANMQATSLITATGVGMWVFLGDGDTATPAPCLDDQDQVCGQHLMGTGSFTISRDSPPPENTLVIGQNVGGQFTGGPGNLLIEVALVEGSSLVLTLIGARMEIGQVSDNAVVDGKFGGAITKSELDNTVLPTLSDLMADTISRDCTGMEVDCPGANCRPCGCEEGATGRTLLDLFDDESRDCKVTLEELKANSLVSSQLAPDVDLLNCPNQDSPPKECEFNPRKDGVKDSLSLGIGFTAISGSFSLPASISASGE